MSKKKLRSLSDITFDLETLLIEMTDSDGHDMQWGEVLHLVHGYMMIHLPHAQEVYEHDGSSPTFFYGWKELQPEPSEEESPEDYNEYKNRSQAW